MKTATAQALTAVFTLAAMTVLALSGHWVVMALVLAFGFVTVAAMGGAEDRRRREQQKAGLPCDLCGPSDRRRLAQRKAEEQ